MAAFSVKFLSTVSAFSKNLLNRQTLSSCRAFISHTQEQAPEDEFHVNYLDGDRKGIVVLSMRRFKARNAMGRNIIQRFIDGCQQIKHDNTISVVILRSEVPNVFCAGADLKERAEMNNKEVGEFVQKLRGSVTELANLPMPTIAAIDGFALGGGLEISLGCDMRVAASNAKIGLVETSLGLIPGAGGTQRLCRVVGPSLAKELIFTSRRLDGFEARDLGVVNHAVQQNDAGDAAYQRSLELAEEILPNAPIALRMGKLAVNRGIEVDLDSGLKYEEAYYAQIIPTKDRLEGLQAFKEKRKPKYQGH
ncbi:enoyl-CoA hydratase domain-containing protein 2, mitochondrial [Patella vulgata]|uniref:enoyl-CoA hydratase domain-containing protein 2, mitochondrial n=1 Tax=Patella vulgata TaxID=6465 RepID=UPI00218014DE|nr:enoyl-CoA hydratase domain-containing protein 2, mitochondrial [Patella vulgata]